MPRTVGVEEEFLLFRVGQPVPVSIGGLVAERVDERSDGQFEHELKRQQAEVGTAPHENLTELATELRRRRAELGQGATEHGARIVATGTSPIPSVPRTTPNERYERMRAAFGETARVALSCGMHVHVAVGTRDEGARVLNRLRCWLPVVLALSANSPLHDGRDTGYASYRSVLWQQWPTAGAYGPFADAADYDATTAAVIETGAAMDDGMIYFDARLSAKYPTVEIRAADVCPRVTDAVTLAGLCRGLVDAAAAGLLPRTVAAAERVEVARGATWRAARHGMGELLWDPVSGLAIPAWDLVDSLVAALADAAEPADVESLRVGLKQIRERGTGSVVQRGVQERTGDLGAVVDELAALTLSDHQTG
ncbi:MAG TPA: glutamate--cysteine ligase [Jatrophihabitans sp.]|nr:glutamate--cysteine ligase [Jatrophihabitans sp.]